MEQQPDGRFLPIIAQPQLILLVGLPRQFASPTASHYGARSGFATVAERERLFQ
jgi:hypothetical protein